jgi:hypothetical protein
VKQLSDYPNEAFLLVRREADGPPEWHETQSDVFFVQSGSATLIVGGTVLKGETVAPHEKRHGNKAAIGTNSRPETLSAFRPACRIGFCSMAHMTTSWSC